MTNPEMNESNDSIIEPVEVVLIDGQVFTKTILPATTRTRKGGLSQRGAVKLSARTTDITREEANWLGAKNAESTAAAESIKEARDSDYTYPGGTYMPHSHVNEDYTDHISADES